MPKFRKKPVEIEARRLTSSNGADIAQWCGGTVRGAQDDSKPTSVQIRTLEGTMTADIGDWIIRGVQGEFYPCKPGVFEATYDPADGAA